MVQSDKLEQFVSRYPTWNGRTVLSETTSLDFSVVFAQTTDQITGLISIPAQKAYDIPLQDIHLENDTLYFTLKPGNAPKIMWARYQFNVVNDATELTGVLRQAGKEFPSTLAIASFAAATRPQTPVEPFPYTVRNVSYTNPADGATLAGTLTLPEGSGPHPAAVLITGSGQQDRDESLFEHKPFWVIADHLTRQGIAVLRVDDRGVGESTGASADMTTATFAGDVSSGLDFLQTLSDTDPKKIGLIGHSEGGLIGAMVSTQRSDVAFLISLAGPGVPGFDLLLRQNADILRANQVSEADVSAYLPLYEKAMDPNLSVDQLPQATEELVRFQYKLANTSPTDENINAAIQQFQTLKSSSWMQLFLTLDPAQYYQQVSCPVLALNGTLDRQVAHDQNLIAIEQALKTGHNPPHQVKALDGLNHLFQQATTGSPAEYAQIEETFSEDVLNLLHAWIHQYLSPDQTE